MIALALFAQLAVAPKAAFVVTCQPPNGYRLDASSSAPGNGGPLVSYRWTFADGTVATTTDRATSHTWPAGRYVVKLSVRDSALRLSNPSQKTVTLPCAPVTRIDTLIRHDTVVIRDTISLAITLPIGLPSRSGIYTDSSQVGQPIRFYRMCLLGMGQSGRRGVSTFVNNRMLPSANDAATITGFFPQVGVFPSVDAAGVVLDSLAVGCK